MRLSKLIGKRVKETPSNATLKSHSLLLRAGFVKQVGAGIFSLLPPAHRIVSKISNILREEMNKIGGQEVLFPVVMPRELWDASGRYDSIKTEMVRFKDRNDHDMLLGMTHEEASVHMMQNTATSHDDLPCMIYQIQTKFRDEARPRGGLIRVREFTMKDGYSFHTSQEDLESYYEKVYKAYNNIFQRIGFENFIVVEGDNGVMGGKISHEYMAVTEAGEDSLVVCDACDYSSNMEVATSVKTPNEAEEFGEKDLIFTGNAHSIEEVCAFLEIETKRTAKAVVFREVGSGNLVLGFLRGDAQINESKLKKLAGDELEYVDPAEFGLKAGNIGLLELDVPEGSKVFYDESLRDLCNFVTGANEEEYHIKNVCTARDLPDAEFVDFALVSEGEKCVKCGAPLKTVRGIEIGNIFQLGDKYTKAMGMKVNMPDGSLMEPIMGCYGIGVGRALASIIEEKADDKGMVWPISIAPWQVHLCPIRIDDENVETVSYEIYKKLQDAGIDVLFDDRTDSAGVKLTDSELMGTPIRIVVSPKTLANGEAEITIRETGEKVFVPLVDILAEVKGFVDEAFEKLEK